MILQEILIDENDKYSLYFRIRGVSFKKGNKLVLVRNTILSTNTYYNSFSIGKWKEYCNINKIKLFLTIQGEAEISIIHSIIDENNHLKNNTILSRIVSVSVKHEIEIDLPDISDGVVYFSIECLSNSVYLYEAKYVTESVEKDVNIALNICTYKREHLLLRTIQLIKKQFIEKEDSPLYGHLKIFIIDNGKTLNASSFTTKDIYLFYNPNVGGAGGFSRGLLEILKRREKEQITNVIFMDDDIEILPEVLLRTYRILKILKPKYEHAFLAGAILRQDYKYIQFENAAQWNGGKVLSLNQGLDLRVYKNVVYNEIEKVCEYAAWCYCCIPAKILTSENLAIPVFIHMDDIEYSLRNTDKIITLNGISVIHPVSGQRIESTNVYYDFRNMMILDAKYCPTYKKKKIKKELFERMLNLYIRYRYEDIKLLYQAVDDFCKGPDWLIQLDAVTYHAKIKEEGYQFEDVSEIVGREIPFYEQYDNPVIDYFGNKKRRWTVKKIIKLIIIIFTINGIYLPPKEKKAFGMNVSPARFFRHPHIVLYDKNSMQGITLHKDVKKIFLLMKYYVKACSKINKKYDFIRKEYEQVWNKLHGQTYWGKVLK